MNFPAMHGSASRLPVAVLAFGLLVAASPVAVAEVPVDREIERALERLYNFDFAAAHTILEGHLENRPDDPLGHAFQGAVFLFEELDRLRILETEFFRDDDRLASRTASRADPDTRRRLLAALDRSEELAEVRLEADPDDTVGLFALCLKRGLLTDYMALVEKKGLRSLRHAWSANRAATQLLELEPDFADAHIAGGISEYLVGSMPFFVRWFVRIEGVEGDKERAFERMQIVADDGRYLGPFAKILLSIMALREKKPELARELLAELSREYPENPLLRNELDKVTRRLAAER